MTETISSEEFYTELIERKWAQELGKLACSDRREVFDELEFDLRESPVAGEFDAGRVAEAKAICGECEAAHKCGAVGLKFLNERRIPTTVVGGMTPVELITVRNQLHNEHDEPTKKETRRFIKERQEALLNEAPFMQYLPNGKATIVSDSHMRRAKTGRQVTHQAQTIQQEVGLPPSRRSHTVRDRLRRSK